MSGQALPRELATRQAVWSVDLALLLSVVALAAIGLVMVASASITIAAMQYDQALYFFWRQLVFACIGVLLAYGVARIPLSVWRASGPWLLLASVVLLALVLIPGIGRSVKGSWRWISLGPVNVQPSELVKVFWLVYLSGYLVRRSDHVQARLSGFFNPIGVLSLIAILLLMEPDYGATVVLFATTLAMLFLAGVPFLTFLTWGFVIGLVFVVMVLAAPYRLERLLAFVNPFADPYGSGFQLSQALIAIGRGEWFGVGLGESVQKLFYLPEAHNDFLFAVLAEELGLVGALAVILLFTLLVLRAFAITRDAERRGQHFIAFLSAGVGLLIGLQAYINIGVNVGLLPTKGLNLPFMSYGGSNLIANCIAVGLLFRASKELNEELR